MFSQEVYDLLGGPTPDPDVQGRDSFSPAAIFETAPTPEVRKHRRTQRRSLPYALCNCTRKSGKRKR